MQESKDIQQAGLRQQQNLSCGLMQESKDIQPVTNCNGFNYSVVYVEIKRYPTEELQRQETLVFKNKVQDLNTNLQTNPADSNIASPNLVWIQIYKILLKPQRKKKRIFKLQVRLE